MQQLTQSQTDYHALSFAQQRLWLLDQLTSEHTLYIHSCTLSLTGTLDIWALKKSLHEIARRHEILRTTIISRDGSPVLSLIPELTLALPVTNLEGLSKAAQEARLQEIMQAQRSFAVEQEPLLHVNLVRMAENQHVLLVNIHQIIADAHSLHILLREMAVHYSTLVTGNPAPLPALPRQYSDYARQQQEDFQENVREELLRHWRTYLAGVSMPLDLPTDHSRPATQRYHGKILPFHIAPELYAELQRFSQEEEIKISTILLAAFQILLARYTGRDDFLIGMSSDGRQYEEDAELIGPFANTQVLRSHCADNLSWRQFLQYVRADLQEHEVQPEVPFELLVEGLQSEHNVSYHPLVQVLFTMQEPPLTTLELPALHTQIKTTQQLPPGLDLALSLQESENNIEGMFAYNSDLFEQATIDRLQGHFLMLLRNVLSVPEQSITTVAFLTPHEEEYLFHEVNHTRSVKSDLLEQAFHQLFEAQVQRTPEFIAAIFEDKVYTYTELNARANQFAHFLRSSGVGPEVVVAICMERSLDMLVALLGIFKAGGAYLPLDPTYPVERLTFMIEDGEVSMLVTQHAFIDLFPAYHGQMVSFEQEQARFSALSQENLQLPVQATQLAYMIYTSGSTGVPKGVQIEQRALVNFLCSMRDEPGISEHDCLLAVTTLSFDIAGLEIYLPLLVGARVVIASRAVASNGSALMALLKQERITMLQATPITWRILLASGWEGDPALRILCGGEALPLELAQQLLPKVQALYNMYGPTETTIWSMLAKIESQPTTISIGHPIANTRVYVLDRHFQPVPLGVAGELCIGGTGLARGYWKRPELTAERFVQVRLADQEQRLYRTGDLARYRSDGSLELIGRLDQQIKLRGHRIELGEIEAILDRHPAVAQAIVIVRGDEGGAQRLVAYLLPQAAEQIDSGQLRQLLHTTLPAYMIPSEFVILETLPLTPNGKVDRRALAELATSPVPVTEIVGPRTAVEEILVQIWQQVLKRSRFSIYDDFFEIGGHSLLATQVLARLRRTFRMQIDLQEVFEARTVAQIAAMLVRREPVPGHVTTVARIHQQISALSPEELRVRLASNTNISHEEK